MALKCDEREITEEIRKTPSAHISLHITYSLFPVSKAPVEAEDIFSTSIFDGSIFKLFLIVTLHVIEFLH